MRRSGRVAAPDPVLRYDEVAASLLAGRHGVCSPLGAWLLLALVADSATGAERTELAGVLGCDPAAARRRALTLLRDPHPDVVAAAALWFDDGSAGLDDLAAAVSPPAATGAIPSQADADRWAAEHTLDLIERFPVELTDALVVLATALATKISWLEPYEAATADELRLPCDPAFAGAPLLRAPVDTTWSGIVEGRYAVHGARSQANLVVVSAIGDARDDPADVLAVARRSALARAVGGTVPGTTSLFDLPLGFGPAWELTEGRGSRPERVDTVLPAWDATSDHDLLADPVLGFGTAGRVLAALLPRGPQDVRARQVAVARYTRTGFEAAAVTGLMVSRSAAMPVARTMRTARLEFTHPYAVVAAAGGDGPWRGLPVFSAWVAEASARS